MSGKMTYRYRGYDLVPRKEGSRWRVSVYSTRPDLPLLCRSAGKLTTRVEEGLRAAKQSVDLLLSAG